MRFLLRFQLGLLLGASGGLALLFGLTDYPALARAVRHPAYGPYFPLAPELNEVALSSTRYLALRLGLVAVALVAAGLLGLTWRRPGRVTALASPRPVTLPGLTHLGAALRRPWQQLNRAERRLGAGLLLAVAGARLYYAAAYPLSLDELASYDYYALPGAAVTASYYPFPNNHILANLLVGQLHHWLPGAAPGLALRLLPTLLGLLALPLTYALVLRHLRFGAATLGLGLYWLSPMAVYYAVAGRGYAWALLATLAGLLAALELLRPGARAATRRLAWAVFGLSGVGGLYAVPTHAYALAALGLGLLVGFGRQPRRRRGRLLGQLAGATAGIGGTALVLYAPVGAVSGWGWLLANRYVAHQAGAVFWAGVGPFLVGTATELLGQRGLSALAYVAVLALAPLALRRGRLPAATRRLGWLLLAQLGLWLPLSLLQHLNPPARTLLPALLAFFLLLAIGAQAAWAGLRPWAGRVGKRWLAFRPLLVLVFVLAGYGGYRLHREQAVLLAQARQQAALRQAYAWLQRQPLRRIWVGPRAFAIQWQHYALSAGQRPLPLVVRDDLPAGQPGPGPEVQVLPPGALPAGSPRPVRYRNELLLLVPVSPTHPLLPE